MRIEKDTVIFKTGELLYGAEKSGDKDYTVRILDSCEVRTLWSTVIKTVRIEHKLEARVFFERKFLSAFKLGEVLGKTLVGIAWKGGCMK